MPKTVIDHCIEWNRNKAKRAKTPEDKARYEENIGNLRAYKDDNSST